SKEQLELILQLMLVKSGMKQDVFAKSKEVFGELKEVLKEFAENVEASLEENDPRLHAQFEDLGDLVAQLKVAGDTIIFHMHTNVFKLDQSHSQWKTGYLEEDEQRGYFGVVNIYNFLTDSFKFDRERDLGYLVARLFLNKDGHFFLQGKRQLGFLYNDLPNDLLNRSRLVDVARSVVLYVLDFDLLAPPYDQVKQVTVEEMKQLNTNSLLSTGKRLGFRFQADSEDLT
ncbi:MAG: hypothetical protein ABI373_03600, partial [Flavobacteriales bacterium]